LVVTLWLIITLALVAVALGRYLSSETALMRYHVARAQAKAWARSGVYLALERLAADGEESDGKTYDWLGDDWAAGLGGPEGGDVWTIPFASSQTADAKFTGTVSVRITDEERRLDLNAASEASLTRLLDGNGEAAKAILDYRDKDDTGTYEHDPALQPPYDAKNARLAVLEELWEIPTVSVDPLAQHILQQEGTVFLPPGPVKMNINTASPDVLKSLVDPLVHKDHYAELLNAIDQWVNVRPGQDGKFGTNDDCVVTTLNPLTFTDSTCADRITSDSTLLDELFSLEGLVTISAIFRIRVDVRLEKPVIRSQVEALVRRGASEGQRLEIGGVKFQILHWKESS